MLVSKVLECSDQQLCCLSQSLMLGRHASLVEGGRSPCENPTHLYVNWPDPLIKYFQLRLSVCVAVEYNGQVHITFIHERGILEKHCVKCFLINISDHTL